MHHYKRTLLWYIFPLIVSLFLLGYWREFFFILVERFFSQFTVSSHPVSSEKYPSTFGSIWIALSSSYKWLASFLYSFLFAVHATAIVACVYQSKRLVCLTIGVYLSLVISCLLLILLGNAFHSYTLGYGLAQHLKLILQSPLLVALLVATFRLFSISTPRSLS